MLTISNLTKEFQTPSENIRVLSDLNLTLAKSDAISIVGPSGSGKSTLLNLLGALDQPTSGSITIDGQDLSSFSEKEAATFRNQSLGFVFQQHHLLPQLNVLENVLLPRLAGGWTESPEETETRARDLLESVGLSERLNHFPWQLSGGEKLRTALARALINQPSLLLADEPTGSLDESTTETVAELLLDLNRSQNVTLIVVTHNRSLAERIGPVHHLANGQLTLKQ